MSNEAIIEIKEITKVYGMGEVQVRALDEVYQGLWHGRGAGACPGRG
jgi:hypothetical protein